MSLRFPRTVAGRIAGAALVTAVAIGFAGVSGSRPASADPSATPPWPSPCLPANQKAGNPVKGAPLNAPFTPYEVPFRAIIFNGSITIPPNIVVPHLYASACGFVQLPQLSGKITSSQIVVATPNVYVAGLEALPVNISFGGLEATINLTPAHNGGLDISVAGSTTAAVSTLDSVGGSPPTTRPGITCSLTLDAHFTTHTDGTLVGQPVTGSTTQGQAVTVSNSFPVPAVIGSNSGMCPPSVAGAFNQALHLPAAPGIGKFNAPFCFDFELMNTDLPTQNPACPWPTS
jgi:hypothetical protein